MTVLPEIESAVVRAVQCDVAARSAQPRPVRSARAWLRARHRGLVVVLAALVTAGAATAAGTLSGEPSRPLRGTIPVYGPGGGVVRSLGAAHYSIGGMVPSLAPGEVGWCVSDWISGSTRTGRRLVPSGSGGSNCTYAPAVGRAIFASDNGHGPGVHFFLTAPDVYAVRVNGTLTILTRTDPGLPFGLRAAVFDAALNQPGAPDVVALDRDGRVIANSAAVLPTAPLISWLAPSRQPGGACSIGIRAGGPVRLYAGIAVPALVPVPGLEGRAFLSCVELELIDGQYSLEAALLLDAAHPGSAPAPLPGMRPVPRHPGMLDRPNGSVFPDGGDRGLNPTFLEAKQSDWTLFDPYHPGARLIPLLDGGLSARRVGNAWLVVQGGSGTVQRLAVLAALRTGHVELRGAETFHRPPGARCWLNVAPTRALTLVDEEGPDRRLQRSLGGECEVAVSLYFGRWPIEALFASPHAPASFGPESPIARPPTLTVRTTAGWLEIIGGSGAAQRRALARVLTIVGG